MSSIDVVVPCYRYGHYLRECVDSVLTQSVADVRVLIIDDASPDDTAEVGAALAAQDQRVSFRRHAVNQGHIATYNEGIAWVRSRYLLLLSADDYLLPGALARALTLLHSDPSIGFCFGDAPELHACGRLSDSAPSVPSLSKGPPTAVIEGRDFIELCRRRGTMNFVPTPTAVVRTSLQQQLGGYRAALPHSADLELWLRLAAHAKVGYVASAQAVYRRHGDNMSLGYVGDNRLRDLLQRKAAVETFCSDCEDVLKDWQGLQAGLLRPLGLEAVRCANAAFNADRPDLCDAFLRFAGEAYPNFKASADWWSLACKQRLGQRVWHAVSPSVGRVRKVASSFFG